LSPWGDIKTTPAPAPWTLLEPSKYIVQVLDKSGDPMLCSSSHSAVKSGKTCDLIAFLFCTWCLWEITRFPTKRHILLLKDCSICSIVALHWPL
jgi:hypothetical protein